MSKEAMDFMMGSGVPSASFLSVGTKHVGRVLAMEKRQQRDLDGNKKFWDDGEPMWQIVFTIDTGVIDPSIDGDDGTRNVYAKAQMLTAIREAVKKSGHRGDLVGGKLGVKYAADGEATKRGFNPPKIYSAVYEAPTEADMLNEVAEQEPTGSPQNEVDLTEYEDFGEEPF